MFGEQHVQQIVAQLAHFGAVRLDQHAVFHRRGAGGGSVGPPLHLNDAHAAAAVRWQTGEIAQGGDINVVRAGRLQDGLPAFRAQRAPVDV